MILADTSIWIDHFRTGDALLIELLQAGEIVVHPFVIGELALGNIRRRRQILDDLNSLPHAPVATDDEVLHFIEHHGLFGVGIGYIDAHLLAAAKLGGAMKLWSRDKRLSGLAARLNLAL